MLVVLILLLLSIIIIEFVILFPRQKENLFSQVKLIYTTSYFLSQKNNPSLIDVKTNAQYQGIIKELHIINEGKNLRFYLGNLQDYSDRGFAITLPIHSLSVLNELEEKISYKKLKIGDKININITLNYKKFLSNSLVRKIGENYEKK